MSDLNDKLLPCAHCGGKAKIHEMDDYHMAACDCGVGYEGPTSEDCAAAWNRRATPAPQAAPSGLTYEQVADAVADNWPMDKRYKLEEIDARLRAMGAAAPASLTPAPQGTASDERHAKEAAQRERMAEQFAGRNGAATADFDLPAPNDAPIVTLAGDGAVEERIKTLMSEIGMGDDTPLWTAMKKLQQYIEEGVHVSAASLTQAATSEPVAYVNGDELDNMLNDRTATIQSQRSGWRATPLFRHAAPPAAQQAPSDERAAFEAKEIAYHQAQHPMEPLTEKEKAYVLRRSFNYDGYEACEQRWQGWQWRAALSAQQAGGKDAKPFDWKAFEPNVPQNFIKVDGCKVKFPVWTEVQVDRIVAAALASMGEARKGGDSND